MIRNAAVVIATAGRSEPLANTLASLGVCEWPEVPLEVIVIENGPKGIAEEICEKAKSQLPLRYFYRAEPGKSRTLNCALNLIEADFLIFFDDDVRIGGQSLRSYTEAAVSYGRGTFFGGPLKTDASQKCPRWLWPHANLELRGWDLGDKVIVAEPPLFTGPNWFIGSNWAAFRQDILDCRGFAEYLGPSPQWLSPIGEETDLQKRMVAAGMTGVYLPEARIEHSLPPDAYTISYARRRAARHGVTNAMMDSLYHSYSRPLFGIPAWSFNRMFASGLSAITSLLLPSDAPKRIDRELTLAYDAGRILGYYRRGLAKEKVKGGS